MSRLLHTNALFVLTNNSSDDVADAMIEGRHQKEPFYIFDMDVAYQCVMKFREKLPRVQVFYAMKSNDYSMMVKIAIALGLGFDCASPGEIDKIRKFRVNPQSIIYAMPMKSPDQMLFAKESGVRHTTFDSTCELKKLKQFWPNARFVKKCLWSTLHKHYSPKTLLIRIKIESKSVYKLGDKFGCDFAEAVDLLEEAARLDLIVVGVAFHVGSGCFSKESYTTGLSQARALFDHERREGRELSILDIGGGFFDDNTDRFDEVTELINKGLEKLFPEPYIQIIAEPGRYLCESAFTFYNNINDVRSVCCSDKMVNMIYSNDGTNGTLRFLESWHVAHKHKNSAEIELQDTVIWGPTDDKDQIELYKWPPCSVGDWLVFNQQGAYCNTFRTNYCGIEAPLTRSVVSLKLWNKLKRNPVFASEEYLLDPLLFLPLPATLPPIVPDHHEKHYHDTTVLD